MLRSRCGPTSRPTWGHRALEDAEIVVLDPLLTIEREDSAQFA